MRYVTQPTTHRSGHKAPCNVNHHQRMRRPRMKLVQTTSGNCDADGSSPKNASEALTPTTGSSRHVMPETSTRKLRVMRGCTAVSCIPNYSLAAVQPDAVADASGPLWTSLTESLPASLMSPEDRCSRRCSQLPTRPRLNLYRRVSKRAAAL